MDLADRESRKTPDYWYLRGDVQLTGVGRYVRERKRNRYAKCHADDKTNVKTYLPVKTVNGMQTVRSW